MTRARVWVCNLATENEAVFHNMTPAQAAIAAYDNTAGATSMRQVMPSDGVVTVGSFTVGCGDWAGATIA